MQTPHDAFISHSNAAKLTAYAICNELEASGIRCWILPRDVVPGAGWDQSISEAVKSARIVILVLTDYAQRSERVEHQLELAFNHGAVVIPFRAAADAVVLDAGDTAKPVHWIDAITPDAALQIRKLRDTVRQVVDRDRHGNAPITGYSEGQRASTPDASIPFPAGSIVAGEKSNGEPVISPDTSSQKEDTRTRNNEDKSRVINILAVILLPFIVVCAFGIRLLTHGPSVQKQIPSSAAATVQPVPSSTALPILSTPGIATGTPAQPNPVASIPSSGTSIGMTKPPAITTPTATPTPVTSVTPPSAEVGHHLDDIGTSDPGWGTPDANWTIADNKIRLTPLPGNGAILVNTAHRFKDAEIATQVVMSKGEDLDQLGGLIFWAKDYNDCYALVVSADGKFAIGHKLFGRWINPTAKTGSGAVNTGVGQVNKLQIRTSGKTFTAYINDVQVATLSGDPPEGDWLIGLYGESAESSENSWEFSKVDFSTFHREAP